MPEARLVVFLHDGAYDRLHQGLSAAAAAVSLGRRVDVFFFWWALLRLGRDELDEATLASEELADRIEALGAPTLRQLLAYLKKSGLCQLHGCSGSMALVGLSVEQLQGKVDQIVGWTTILQLTAGVADRLYL